MPPPALNWPVISVDMSMRFVLLVGLLLTLVPYGGVYDQFFLPGLTLIALACGFGSLRVSRGRDATGGRIWRYYSLTCAITLAATAFVLLQSLQFSSNIFAHAIWDTAAEAQLADRGDFGGAISVDPGTTRRALLGLIMPALVFLAVLGLYRADDDILRLWRSLFAVGVAIAVFGMLEFLLAPDRLLLMERRHHMRGVTGVFVNVNTAATFFGIVVLMGLGLTLERFRRIGAHKLWRFFTAPRLQWSDPVLQFLVYIAGILATLIALVLTQSRGGVAAAFAAMLLFMFWAAYRYGLREASVARKLITGLAFTVATFAALAQMASRTALRIETRGFEDARFCLSDSALHAIADHWLLGSGLGTFESVFPLYRDPACAFGRHIDMAHNTWIEGMLGLGIAFPLIVTAVFLVLGRALWAARRRRRYRFSGIVGACIIFLISLHAIVDFSLQIPGVAAYAAACIGAAVVLANGRNGIQRARR